MFKWEKLSQAQQKLHEVFMRVLGLIFFLLTTQVLAQRLPNVRGDLQTLPFGKLTQFWAQQAAGIPEGHVFIKELEQNDFSFATPQLGVLERDFSPASMLAGVKLTSQLHEHLSDSGAMYRKIEIHRVDISQQHEHSSASNTNDNVVDVFVQVYPNPLRDLLLQAYAYERSQLIYRPVATNLEHSSAVAYLMASNTPASASLKGKIAMLLPLPKKMDFNNTVALFERIATLPAPQVVNYSMTFGKDDSSSKDFAAAAKLLAEKTFLVVGAGNSAPATIETGKQELAEQLIVVGSADPTGHVSSFSQTGCAETIRACSDHYIQSVDHESGKFFNFGGTSGAAPLVSGALADTMSILPDLSLKQAKLLLQKTSLSSSYGDAIGLLNYYKLLRVAHRLAEQGWSPTTGTEEMLHDRALYDFSAEAEQLTQEAVAAPAQDEAFRKLRQAFFLDHNNSLARKALAAAYRQHGYDAQAFFYDNPNEQARNRLYQPKR